MKRYPELLYTFAIGGYITNVYKISGYLFMVKYIYGRYYQKVSLYFKSFMPTLFDNNLFQVFSAIFYPWTD